MPKLKRSRVWLYFTAKDINSAACNKCLKVIMCKGGNTSNLMKHMASHGVFLKAEKCTAFDNLQQDITPSTSTAGVVPVLGVSNIQEPEEESPAPSPASVAEMITDDDDGSSTCSSLAMKPSKVSLRSLRISWNQSLKQLLMFKLTLIWACLIVAEAGENMECREQEYRDQAGNCVACKQCGPGQELSKVTCRPCVLDTLRGILCADVALTQLAIELTVLLAIHIKHLGSV
ncbi:TNR19 factor, partial [Polypterus senegalus]